MKYHALIVEPDSTMRHIDAPMSMLHRLKKMTCGIGTSIVLPPCRISRRISTGSSCLFISDVIASFDIMQRHVKKNAIYIVGGLGTAMQNTKE